MAGIRRILVLSNDTMRYYFVYGDREGTTYDNDIKEKARKDESLAGIVILLYVPPALPSFIRAGYVMRFVIYQRVAATKLAGCYTRNFFKNFAEIIWIINAYSSSDFLYMHVCFYQ